MPKTYEININESDQAILSAISLFDLGIIVLGTLGNLTSFCLLTRKRLRTVSSMRYLAALTLVDTVCLYGWYLSSVYRQLNGEQHLKRIENFSPILCKLIAYTSFVSLQASSCLLCVLAVDRLLIILSNKWRTRCANTAFANKLIAGVILAIALLNSVAPIRLGNQGQVSYHIRTLSDGGGGGAPPMTTVRNFTMYHCYDDSDLLLRVWNKLHLLVYSLLPFPVLFVLNLIVIRRTRDAAKTAAKLQINMSKFKVGQQFVTRLLIFLTLSFFLSTLPSTVVYAFWHGQILALAHGRILLNLLNSLQFFRHAANWCIYVYSSSFLREELGKCLQCQDTEYEMAQAALGNARPSVAIQFLRQLERNMNMNETNLESNSVTLKNNTNNYLTAAHLNLLSNDPDLYYYYLYYYDKQSRVMATDRAGGSNEEEDNDESNELTGNKLKEEKEPELGCGDFENDEIRPFRNKI